MLIGGTPYKTKKSNSKKAKSNTQQNIKKEGPRPGHCPDLAHYTLNNTDCLEELELPVLHNLDKGHVLVGVPVLIKDDASGHPFDVNLLEGVADSGPLGGVGDLDGAQRGEVRIVA